MATNLKRAGIGMAYTWGIGDGKPTPFHIAEKKNKRGWLPT